MGTTIKKADLARHWKVSPAYVTTVLKRHPLPSGEVPAFASYQEADEWRAIHAPPRPASEILRQSSEENPVVSGKKSRNSATATAANVPKAAGSPANNGGGEGGDEEGRGEFGLEHDDGAGTGECGRRERERAGGARKGAEFIDVRQFVETGGDFEAIMLRQAEEVPQIAFGLYRRACAVGNSVAVANATTNWADAARHAAAVRQRFLEVQEKSRALIPLDLVMDIVGTELQALRSLLDAMGDRYGAKANPADPSTGKAAIDEGVDELYKRMDALNSRVKGECETRSLEAA